MPFLSSRSRKPPAAPRPSETSGKMKAPTVRKVPPNFARTKKVQNSAITDKPNEAAPVAIKAHF